MVLLLITAAARSLRPAGTTRERAAGRVGPGGGNDVDVVLRGPLDRGERWLPRHAPGRRVGDDLGPSEREDARYLGEQAVVADHQPDPAVRRREHRIVVARGRPGAV